MRQRFRIISMTANQRRRSLVKVLRDLARSNKEIERLKGCMRVIAKDLDEGGKVEDAVHSLLFAAAQTPETLAAMQKDSGVSYEELLEGLSSKPGEGSDGRE